MNNPATNNISQPCNPAPKIYAPLILEHAPRVLGMMDRDETSRTAGCCDRTFWAWKFVDFPGARFQEALCLLGFLQSTEFAGNQYYRNERVLDWIDLGLQFWASMQHEDGSFDEAYPFERSLAATAFTAFYVGEAVEFLGENLRPETRKLVRETMRKAGKWLTGNDESHGFLSNHLAAAAASLLHIFRLTGDEAFERRSRYFLDRILDRQSAEGWYDEYGGADPGYQTHGSFYLARYWQLTGDRRLDQSLDRSMKFLALFIHPDGSLGGEYASRNTQTYYPAAFEICAQRHGTAAWIAETMRSSVLDGAAVGLRGIDVYNYFPFLNNLVFAYLACLERERHVPPVAEPPSIAEGLTWLPEAGIGRLSFRGYEAWIGAAKGGVVKVFDRARKRLIYSDCGYIGRLRGGQWVSTQYQEPQRRIEVRPDRVVIHGHFRKVTRPTMSPLRLIGFRLFSLTLGRLPGLGRWLKRQLVRTLIHHQPQIRIGFKRTIVFDEMGVGIDDELGGPDGDRVAWLKRGQSFTTIHMGSSRYFIANELRGMPVAETDLVGNPESIYSPADLVSGIRSTRYISIDQLNE